MTSPSESTPSSNNTSSTVLVTGGRGFVGSHVVRQLLARGCRVCAFGPVMAQDLLHDLGERIDTVDASIDDRQALGETIQRLSIDCVVHTAAYSAGQQGLMRSGEADADQALSINVLGFRHVLDAAVDAGIKRVVWSSSSVVYGPADHYADAAVDETAPCKPMTLYGLSKQLAENVASYYRHRHQLSVTGLRLPLVLGPGLWYQGAAHALMKLFDAARTGRSWQMSFHDEAMDLMHVDDAAAALVSVLLHSPPADQASYNINGFTACVSELIATVHQRQPDWTVNFEAIAPTITFPLMDDSCFRRHYQWQPAFDKDRFVDSLLASTP